jgi:hypothetical protein
MGRPRTVIARQDRRALQHNEATARSEMERERLLAGKDDSTMSVKRFWKAASPICGVVADVAPGGVQMTKPVLQSPFELREDAESAVARAANIAKRTTCGLILSVEGVT